MFGQVVARSPSTARDGSLWGENGGTELKNVDALKATFASMNSTDTVVLSYFVVYLSYTEVVIEYAATHCLFKLYINKLVLV